MFYHWRSSDAKELFEKTVLRRVSLVVLVVLCLSYVSTGRLVIDQHCLHGQYHSLFTNTTCVQSTCSRVISPDRQPYIITQEELPSANRLLMGYSISLWIQVDIAKNYTNRHLISLTDSRGKDLWRISINGINGRKKSRTISLLIKSVLNRKPNILLSVRLSNKQQLATWNNVLFSFHSNGQITPYFDGFVGEHQWIPVVNSGDHHIILGADQDKHKFNLQYKDPFVFTRPLSEADAIALQQNHHLTDGATLHPHCLCPEGYTLSLINQYLCVSGNDDQQVSRIKDDSVDTIIWPQHNNKRLKRYDGSGDDGSGMDSSVIISTSATSSVVTVFSSVIPSESVRIGTSTLITSEVEPTLSTSEVEGSGEFSTIISLSEVTSSIPFTSTPVSPLPSPPIVSSTILQSSEVAISSATIITTSINVTQSFSATESTAIFFSTVNASTVSTIEITPSFTLMPSTANATTIGIFSTTEITPTFTITPSTSSAVFSTTEITPSFTLMPSTANATTVGIFSTIEITPTFTITPSTSSAIFSTIELTPTFSSAISNTTTSMLLTSDITPSFTISITDTVVSSAINITSISFFSEIISTTITTSQFSQTPTSSVIVTSSVSSVLLTSDITPSFTMSITDTVVSSATSTSFFSEVISTTITTSQFSQTPTSSVIVTSPVSSVLLTSDITPSFTMSITDTVVSSATSTSFFSEVISTTSQFSQTPTSSVIVTSPVSSMLLTSDITPSFTMSITDTVVSSATSTSFFSEVISTTSQFSQTPTSSVIVTSPVSSVLLTSDITPSFTMSITDTVVSSATSTSFFSEVISTTITTSQFSQTPTSSIIVTSPVSSVLLTSDITPSFTMSITDTVVSSATSTSFFSEVISTTITTSQFSQTPTSSVIVTSPVSSVLLTSDITPSFTMSITDTVVSSATLTSFFSEVISTTIITTSQFSQTPTSSVIVTSPVSSAETTSVLFTSTNMSIVETVTPTMTSSGGIDFTSVMVSPTFGSVVSVVSTQSLVVTVTPTSSITIVPTVITLSSITELTSVTPLPTPTVSSSIELIPNTTSASFLTLTTSFTVLPTTLFSTSSEFISPLPTTTFALNTTQTSVISISSIPSSTEIVITTSMSSIETTPIISSAEFTSTTFMFTSISPTPSSITNLTTILLTSDTGELTPTTILSLSSSLVNTLISTTEIVPTMTTSVITSEILSSTVDVTSSLEATFTSSFEATFTSSFETTPTTIGVVSTITSSFDLTSEISSPTVISTLLSTEFVPTMTTSGIVNITSETSSPSSPVPTSEVQFTTTSPTISLVSSTIEIFSSSNITDFTPTPSFTVSLEVSITPTSVLQSSSIVSSVFTTEILPNSTAIETSPPSSIEFVSSTISEVISSTIPLPTQTFITTSEVTPSTIMFSSAVPTTTIPAVSPTPTMPQCSSGTMFCDILMACIPNTQECPIVPKAPITVLSERGGFLIDKIEQDENNNNQYTFKFRNFINTQNEGTIISELGSLQESETFAIPSQINYTSLEGHIVRNKIAPNDPIHVVVQAHNLSILSTRSTGSFSVVVTVNDTNTNYSMADECTITIKSGYCIGRIDLEGFNSTSTAVDISVMDLQSRVYVGQVEIVEVVQNNINNNAIIMKLPTRTIYPPDKVTITISSIGYSVKSLLLNCSVNDSSASIMTIPKTNWSTLFINNGIENQLAISHERVTEAQNEYEEEILCMEVNFKDYRTDQIEVKCQLNELLLTNRVLVDDLNIAVLDRNNMRNTSGYIFLANDSVIHHLVAYSNETVLFNSAVINDGTLEYDLVVKGITVTGAVVDLMNLNCISSNSGVLKVMSDCSRVFLDGTETAGSISVAINVYYESLTTTVLLRVWYPETLVLEAEDTVLNAISNWRDPHLDCNHRYQQTLFRVFANVSDGTRTIYRLDVTSYISGILRSSNESVLKVFPNATVQGVSPGTATIIANDINLIQFNVSNELVKAAALEVMLYNNLSITIPDVINLYEETCGTVTLTQESDRAKLLFVNVLFTDSQRMELKQSDFTVNSTCPNSIAVRDNLIHPIGNTYGFKECVKVTLVRDEACNVTDSVEGMANVSIQLSTPAHLEIKLSTYEIIADENISMITGISTEIILQAILYFSNGDQINITLSDETMVATALNMTHSAESLILSASPEHANNKYNITVTNSIYNMSNSTCVNVVQDIAVNLSVHPYPVYSNSNRVNIDQLSPIGNTGKYQQALLKVMLTLPNGNNYNITDNANFTMSPENILRLCSGTDITVAVNSNVTASTNVNIAARFSSLVSEDVTIQVRSEVEPVELQSIDNVIFVPEFRGVQNSTEFVDASVTLSDKTVLLSTYKGNISLYPGLLRFSVSDSTTASIDGNTVTLLGNSLTDNYITAVGQNNLSGNTTFRCDLEAALHDIDLGTNLSLPIAVDRGNVLEIPVHVNSENAALGIFELNVQYSSRELEVDNIVPGEDWATGSLVYQIVTINENTDMVNFGGINYQSEKGKSIHVANITFKANARGTVILNSTIALLTEADLTSKLIARDRDSTAGSLLTVNINEKQRRRDIFYDEPPLMSPQVEIHYHHKRQSSGSSQEFPVGDVNRDREVDLRDVNYLRHYQVENVYDFTSPNGQEILMTYNNTISSLDVNGDGQVNGLDTTELENINFDLLRVINNVTALCSYDSRICTCTIAGELYTVDMQPSPSDDVYILVDFGSTNQSFQYEFNNTYFENGSIVSYNKGDGLYGGIVLAEIKNESNRTIFVVKTNSSFSTPDIGISLVQITVDANNETSDERQSIHVKSGSIYPNTLNVDVSIPNITGAVNIILENGYSPFMNLSNDCPAVVSTTISTILATTAVSTSSLVVPTTTISTTLVTTSASSLTSTVIITSISLTTMILDTSSIIIISPSTYVIPSTSEISSTSEIVSTISPSTSTAATSSFVMTSEVSSTSTPLISTTVTSSAAPTVISSTSEISNTSTPSTSAAATSSVSQTSTTVVASTSESTSTPAITTSSVSQTSTAVVTNTSESTSTPATATSSVSQNSTTVVSSISESTSTPATATSSVSQTSTAVVTSTSESTSTPATATSSVSQTSTAVVTSTSESTSTPATATSSVSQTSTAVVTSTSESTSTPATAISSVSQNSTAVVASTSESTSTPATAISSVSQTSTIAIPSTSESTSTMSTSPTTTSSVPQTSTTLVSSTSTSTPITNTTSTDTSSSGGGSTGAVVAVVVILVIIVTTVVVVIVICWYRRSKRRKTYYFNPASRPSSGLSSNYWFQEEEKIEMSPIDIVPMAPSPCDEQFRDTLVVPNGVGYRNIGYASGTQRSADGGTKPGYFKPSAESSAGPPPPPYTSRHQRRPESTAFDDEVNLSFHDELISQPYLSLGLTPLSQLSPSDNQDVGFFPSLPPPIATAVDDHDKYSIPVDGPLFIDDGKKLTKRNRRAGLETVPEQPTSPLSRYSQGSNPLSPFQRSTQPDESLVFPSASISQDYLRTLSNANNRAASSNYGARNFGFSSQYENDPLIDFNEYGSGYSIHVDSSPESKQNGRNLNYNGASRDSPPDEHHSQFTRGDLRRQGVKRSRGDLSSQRSSQEMMLRHPRKEKLYDDDDDDDLTSILVPRPISPPGVYPPQLSDIHNFTPPVKDQNYGSISSIPSYKEDHHATTLL